ncbi:MAG: cupin domain-containing protein [Candidatus Bathyarchaeota archaeon]|nr:MAG: cupin domain-containing protein [Candidatus Bathyarchaeota archaeon]
MVFDVEKWATTDAVGTAYSFVHHGKFHGVLETKVGAYRGNHVHPVDQYTLLLKGKAKNILHVDGERREVELEFGKVAVVEAGVPHILVPEEDIFTFEWWDGDFVAEECEGLFDDLTRDRVGPLD